MSSEHEDLSIDFAVPEGIGESRHNAPSHCLSMPRNSFGSVYIFLASYLLPIHHHFSAFLRSCKCLLAVKFQSITNPESHGESLSVISEESRDLPLERLGQKLLPASPSTMGHPVE